MKTDNQCKRCIHRLHGWKYSWRASRFVTTTGLAAMKRVMSTIALVMIMHMGGQTLRVSAVIKSMTTLFLKGQMMFDDIWTPKTAG